jgi:hypothetical protein
MAFVKLDTGILNSTLWFERECRDIFITSLLMAELLELREPLPQLKVNAIEETGFEVPPGWYGFVHAAGPGIVRMAMCDQLLGMQALAKLGEPDPESRTPDFEGRRLVRVPGGFVVLNFMKYRDRDYTGAERAKRYRLRQREKQSFTRDVRESRRDEPLRARDVTQAEAEAEADTEIVRDNQPTVGPHPSVEGVGRKPKCPTEKIVSLYHEAMPDCPRCEILTTTRKAHISARWGQVMTENGWTAEQTLEWFAKFFAQMARSKFLTGRVNGRDGKPPFKATLDFLMRPESFAKAVEGVYRDKEST